MAAQVGVNLHISCEECTSRQPSDGDAGVPSTIIVQ